MNKYSKFIKQMKEGENMKVYEFKLKVYVLENMNSKRSLEYISQLIDKSFLKNKELSDFHEENAFKNYVHNSFYPVEKSKIYQKGNIYTIIIRTVDERLADHFEKYLANEYTRYLKALTVEKNIIPDKGIIEKIYSITPAVAKFEEGYWRKSESIGNYEKRLEENLVKKYNDYFNKKIEENFELFTFLKFDNMKPIASEFKNIQLLGDKLTLYVAENKMAQKLAYFALGVGILELNSRGFGYVNCKWL